MVSPPKLCPIRCTGCSASHWRCVCECVCVGGCGVDTMIVKPFIERPKKYNLGQPVTHRSSSYLGEEARVLLVSLGRVAVAVGVALAVADVAALELVEDLAHPVAVVVDRGKDGRLRGEARSTQTNLIVQS